MAAGIIANELDSDLYKIDLSGVVSKYIGKRKRTLTGFSAAENANAILFFDEADALFGRRSRYGTPMTGMRISRYHTFAKDGGVRRYNHPGHQPAPEPG